MPPARATDVVQQTEIIGVPATEVQQVLVELGPGDTLPSQPFDLNWRALAFIPDSAGDTHVRFIQSIGSVASERLEQDRCVADV